MEHMHVRIPSPESEKVAAMAKRDNRSASQMVTVLVRVALNLISTNTLRLKKGKR